MATPVAVLAKMSGPQFQHVLAASPKPLREQLFRSVGIKKAGGAFTIKTAAQSGDRGVKLHAELASQGRVDERLIGDLVRNYLFTRRKLLADALDFFDVAHDDGLTEADLDFFESLPHDRIVELRTMLEKSHDATDVALYLSFMNVPTD